MAMYCKAQSQLTTAIKPNRPSYLRTSVRVINDSKKGRSYRWKHNVKIKNSAKNDRRRPWRTLRDNDATDAQQLQWRRDPA